MAVAYGAAAQPAPLCRHYRPPLLPKPGKDNARLQKLLKRTAKKKPSAAASQPAVLFRCSLSPVNEASADLERSDRSSSTPPRTPEAPPGPYAVQPAPPPPRFSVRPLYQHVASPYPQRARFSPQAAAMPAYSYSQHAATVSSYSESTHFPGNAPGPVAELAVPRISLPASCVAEATAPANGVKTPAFSTLAETPKTRSPGPTSYSATGGRAVIRPLVVLTPHGKSRSPRPTFRATERSRSPRPMFAVPQIRMYTASTSFYESSRTTPVYDTAGLTAIGSTVPQSKTPAEIQPDFISAPEVRRGTTPTAQLPLLGADPQRKTPTSGMNAIITPTAEIKRATPTAEIKRATPTAEIKRATPTAEIRVKTPTFEVQTSRASAGRPRTPAYLLSRATTPVFEVSKPNPLLFAVSPITVEPERSRTPKRVPAVGGLSASQSVKTVGLKPTETTLNGDIHSEIPPAVRTIQQSITKSKPEPDLTRGTAPAGSQGPTTPTTGLKTPVLTSYNDPRPKTPTYEASRLMTTSPGYKRPKTPTYGTSPVGVSPVAFQRPKTPTQVTQKPKSGYRGLTPAEYAAHGGIRTYAPAFGISGSKEEVQAAKEESAERKTTSREASVETSRESEPKGTPKDVDEPRVEGRKDAVAPSIPTIVVSRASDASGTTSTQETRTASCRVAATQETTLTQETPKATPPTAERRKAGTQVQEVAKPKTKPLEAKHPATKSEDQDPLKAVRKLMGKDEATRSGTEAKTAEDKASGAAAPSLPVSTSAVASTGSGDKDKKAESTSAVIKAATEKTGGGEPLPAEPLLKVIQKPKGVKSKLSGWSRLKKHMVVEQEEPKFPETGSQKEAPEAPGAPVAPEAPGPDRSQVQKADKKADIEKAAAGPGAPDENQTEDAPVAAKMWNAVLFQMFSTEENIMHQIEMNKSQQAKDEPQKDEWKEKEREREIPSFAHRLPVLLFSPKFDAKRLREAASRPVTKISTVFEMGLIGRKGKEEEPKDFNRTARGFAAT